MIYLLHWSIVFDEKVFLKSNSNIYNPIYVNCVDLKSEIVKSIFIVLTELSNSCDIWCFLGEGEEVKTRSFYTKLILGNVFCFIDSLLFFLAVFIILLGHSQGWN